MVAVQILFAKTKNLAFSLILVIVLISSNGVAIETSLPFHGQNISISLGAGYGGAISSLKWGNKEFVDSHDHGREIQSAVTYNRQSECDNPTEAGSSNDGTGYTSSSQIYSWSAANGILTSHSQMANWLAPGGFSIPSNCYAVNSTPLSDTQLKKTVTIGAQGIPNLIKHSIQVIHPRGASSMNLEVVTAYMPQEFRTFYTYDPSTKALEYLSMPFSPGWTAGGYTHGTSSLPIIAVSSDGYAFAMIPEEHDSPLFNNKNHAYYFNSEAVGKWSCAFSSRVPIAAGIHSFTCYYAIGSLSDVTNALDQVYQIVRPKDCVIDEISVLHKHSRRFFSSKVGNLKNSCTSQSIVRYCYNGALSESAAYQYKNCKLINTAPKIESFTGPTRVVLGASVTRTIAASDAQGDDFSYQILWGDNQADSAPSSLTSGQSFSQAHTYMTLGVFNVIARVFDQAGLMTTMTSTIEVTPNYGGSCNLNGVKILHSKTIKAYLPLKPDSLTCASQIRRCSDGILSGSNPNVTCPQNRAPQISMVDGPISVPLFSYASWRINATDPEGGQLNYSVTGSELTGTNSNKFSAFFTKRGNHSFTLKVTDLVGHSMTKKFVVKAIMPSQCTPAQYLQLRPDVASHYYYGTRPQLHYQNHGKNEGMCNPN